MFNSTTRALLKVVSLFVCITFVSGCGTQESAEPSNSQSSTNMSMGLEENDLFELKVPLNEIAKWGFVGAKEDDFIIKSYNDSKRVYADSEVVSVIPDYCLPVASLLLDSKNSGAERYSYYSASKDVLNYFSIGIRTYSSAELAKSKFDEMLSVKDKCGSWIPKYSSGDNGLEWNVGVESLSTTPDTVYWESPDLQEALSLGIVGAAIYEVSVSIEGDLRKAIKIREQAKNYFDNALKAKQL